jgi:hypothetical protein
MTARIPVTLYGKADCHLCDEAASLIERVGAELPIEVQKVDILSSLVLFAQYRYRIPVIEVGGGQLLDWPTTPERLRRAILGVERPR